MNVRIVKRPFGEAPEEVRDAWIGLSLPLLEDLPRLIERRSAGVRTGPRSWLGMLLMRGPRKRGYAIDSAAAVNILEQFDPSAAAWWRTNAPHLFKPGRCFFFNEECSVSESPAVGSNVE